MFVFFHVWLFLTREIRENVFTEATAIQTKYLGSVTSYCALGEHAMMPTEAAATQQEAQLMNFLFLVGIFFLSVAYTRFYEFVYK